MKIKDSKKVKFLILGGGMAGLGASIALRRQRIKDTLILEKEDQIGGLNKNVSVQECDFDIGPKILLLDDSENGKEILSFLNNNYQRYPVIEKTYLSDYGLLGFPLQRHLINLPKTEREKIINDLEASRKHPRKIKSFQDWLINGFGSYFCNLVLFPYETKKWQIPLQHMDYKWALNRPIKVDYTEILEGAEKELPPNKYYYYPKKGNISVLTKAMSQKAGKYLLNYEVKAINLKQRYVNTNHGKFFYEYLISTLALDFHTSITTDLSAKLIKEATQNLKRVSILIFNLVFSGKHNLEGTAIYYPENKFSFRRVSILQNLCPALGRPNLIPISVELSIKPQKTINKKKIFAQILKEFSIIKDFQKLGKPIDWNVLKVDFAYPLQINGLTKTVQKLHKYYQKYNVYLCGRGGGFDYCNSDIAYRQGKETVARIQSITH